jgi:hypothetical protein
VRGGEDDPRDQQKVLLAEREHIVPVALDVEACRSFEYRVESESVQQAADFLVADLLSSRPPA